MRIIQAVIVAMPEEPSTLLLFVLTPALILSGLSKCGQAYSGCMNNCVALVLDLSLLVAFSIWDEISPAVTISEDMWAGLRYSVGNHVPYHCATTCRIILSY